MYFQKQDIQGNDEWTSFIIKYHLYIYLQKQGIQGNDECQALTGQKEEGTSALS